MNENLPSELLETFNRYGLQDGGEITAGNIFFVDSGATLTLDAADGIHGKSWRYPFATLDFAVTQCTDSAGDIIYVAPGHAEAIATATALDLDKIGITIIGKGSGNLRPIITIGGAGVAGAQINVDAAEVTVKNIIFRIALVDVTIMFDVNADGFTLEDCEIDMQVASYEAVTAIDINAGGANDADRCTIRNCIFLATTAGGAGSTQAILIATVQDRLIIQGCSFFGDFGVASIWSNQILTNIIVRDCYIQNAAAGQHALELTANATGFLIGNYYHTNADGTSIDPGACYSFECYANDAAGTSGFLRPVAAT